MKTWYILQRGYIVYHVTVLTNELFINVKGNIPNSRAITAILFFKNLKLDSFKVALIDEKLYNILKPFLLRVDVKNEAFKKFKDYEIDYDFREVKK